MLALLVGASVGVAAAPPELLGGIALPDVVAPLLPAVVNISTLRSVRNAADGSEMKPIREVASGFIIDRDGTIVTNRHVVERAEQIMVTFDDNSSVPARVIATNARPDLALLRVEVDHPLPTVAFGDSDALRTGETVVAIGNPLGLSSSISVGVVSALNRDMNDTMFDDYIQTDAAINKGNSGGPLFNMKGEVIGVNWALVAPGDSGSVGLGLAIPANDAAFVVAQMQRYGRFRAGFIGVRLQQLSPELAAALGLRHTAGGIITELFPQGPAQAAGWREGDVIMEFNGTRPRDVRALLRATSATTPGTTATARLWRDRLEISTTVAVIGWPQPVSDPAGAPVPLARMSPMPSAGSGLSLVPITDAARATYHLPAGIEGALVDHVALLSPVAQAGIAMGDLVLKVGAERVRSPAEAQRLLAAARAQGLTSVVILVQTDDRPHWVAVPLGDS